MQRSDSTPSRFSNREIWLSVGLIALFLLLYVSSLGVRPLVIPDEVRYAEIPREMLSTGDWISPHLVGLRYFEKPPLGYWLNALSIAGFGENEFAVRLPGALAAGATALIVYLFALKIWQSRRMALFAALIQLTFMEVLLVGTFSVLDSFVTLFLCAGIYFYYLAIELKSGLLRSRTNMLLAGAALGLAFLSKGFLGFAVPVLVLVPWMLLQGHWRILLLRSWWLVLAAVLVVLPWALMIHLREPDFWHYFFWVEHIQRFTAENAQHKAPFYYYFMYLPLLAMPWIAVSPVMLQGVRKLAVDDASVRSATQLLGLWVVLPLLFFSASSGKLVTYILPCFPPLAILTAAGLVRQLDRGRKKGFNAGIIFNTGIFVLLGGSLLAAQTGWFSAPAFGSDETWKAIALGLALLAGIVAGVFALRQTKPAASLIATAFIVIPLFAVLPYVIPEQSKRFKSPGYLLSQYTGTLTDETLIISGSNMMHAVAWYLKRSQLYLINAGEVDYGVNYPDARHRYLDAVRFQALLEKTRQPVLLICKRCPDTYTSLLPESASEQVWGDFSVWSIDPR